MIYSCSTRDGPETKYILLKHEYHNKYSNTNIQQFKRANMYSYSIHFSIFVSIGTLLHSTTKTVSSSIFNFHSRFHKINHNYFCPYQYHQDSIFNLLSMLIPSVSSSPCRLRCLAIPLPGTLTYTKCILVHAP